MAENQKCSTCGKAATVYAFEEGSRASGMFLCEEHKGSAGDRTVEVLS